MPHEMKRFIFSPFERNVLLKLIVQHHHILKCKENRTEVVKGKCLAWIDITQKYNATEGVRQCDVKQLRKCWENIKARSRRFAEDNNLSVEEVKNQINGYSDGTQSSEGNDSTGQNYTEPLDLSDEAVSETDYHEVTPEGSTSAEVNGERDIVEVVPTNPNDLVSDIDIRRREAEVVSLIRPNPRKRLHRGPNLEKKPSDNESEYHTAESEILSSEQAMPYLSSNSEFFYDDRDIRIKEAEAVSLIRPHPRKRQQKDPDAERKIKEHEAKLANLKQERECLLEEHSAKMELISLKTNYYREKIKRLKAN